MAGRLLEQLGKHKPASNSRMMSPGNRTSLRCLWKVVTVLFIAVGGGQARFLEVESGRDLHSKCSLMHLVSDLTGLTLKKSFSIDELRGLPRANIPSDLTIIGNGQASVVSMGDCASGIMVGPGVKLEVHSITLDMGRCGVRLASGHGVDGWMFNLGKESQQLISRSTILLEAEALNILSKRLGRTVPTGLPQNFTLMSVEESHRVTFASVVFETQDRGDLSTVQHHPNIVKVESTLDIVEIVELRRSAPQTEAWIPERLVGPCGHDLLLNPISSFKPGTSLRIKPEHQGVGLVDCPMDYVGLRVLEAYEYVSGEDLLLSISDQFSSSGSQHTSDLNGYWKEMFSSMLGDFSCRFVLRNSVIYSNSKNVARWTQVLKKYEQWSPISLQAFNEFQGRAPYLKMYVDGRLTFSIETLAWNGVCMENVTVTSNRSMVSTIFTDRSNYDSTGGITNAFPVLGCLYVLLSVLAVSLCCCSKIQRFWCRKSKKNIGFHNHPVIIEDCENGVSCTWVPLSAPIAQAESSRLSEESYWMSENVSENLEVCESLHDVVHIHEETEKGTSGVTYCGEWRGGLVNIKRIDLENRSDQDSQEKIKNIVELVTRPELIHENLLQTLTYCTNRTQEKVPHYICHRCTSQSNCSSCLGRTKNISLFVVQEYCDMGSICTGLHNKLFYDPATKLVNVDTIVKLSLGIASGMQHLHDCGIVHGELTSKNVLLKAHDRPIPGVTPKITNFGLLGHTATARKEQYRHVARSGSHFRNESAAFCRKADVFSFGALLWEMLHTESACAELGMGYKHAMYPRFPAYCPKLYAMLCIACLSPKPEYRPDFSQIISTLDYLMDKQQSGDDSCVEYMDAKNVEWVESLCESDLLKLLTQLLDDDTNCRDGISRSARGIQTNVAHTFAGCIVESNVQSENGVGRIDNRSTDSKEYIQTGHWNRAIRDMSMVSNSSEYHLDTLEKNRLSGWPQTYPHSLRASRCYSEGGSSNEFSVAVDDELNDNETVESADGNLRFRWSPFIFRDASFREAATIHCWGQVEKDEDYVGSLQEPSNCNKITSPQTRQSSSFEDGAGLLGPQLLPRKEIISRFIQSDSNGSLEDVTEQQLPEESHEVSGGYCPSDDLDDLSYEYTIPPVATARPVYLSQNPIFIPYYVDMDSW